MRWWNSLGFVLYVSRPSVIFRWWKIWKTFPVISWIRAAELFRDGNFREAAELYRKGLRRYPKHVAALCARLDFAYCNYRLGNWEIALKEVAVLCREEQPLRDAMLLQSKILFARSEDTAALSVLRRAVNLFPDEATVLARYVNIALWVKDRESYISIVVERLREAKANHDLEDPKQILIDVAIAHYELILGNREEGEKLLSRAFATGRAPSEAFIIKGEQLLLEGRVVVARELLTRASKMAPQDPRPLSLLAKSYLVAEGNNFDAHWAIQNANAACRTSNWQNIEALQTLVDAYEENGDQEIAELFNERVKELMATKGINFGNIRAAGVQIERLRNL